VGAATAGASSGRASGSALASAAGARGRAGALRARAGSASATLALIAALLVVWSGERVFIGQIHGGRVLGYLAFGALPNGTVAGRGSPDQWWRYVTSALVHDRTAPLHLAVNIAALALVGPRVERLYGKLVFVAGFALAAAAGGVTWMAWSALGFVPLDDYTAGASVGVCGLLGVLLVYGYRTHPGTERAAAQAIKTQAALGIGVITLLGLIIPTLNNAAHLGGLLCGLAVGTWLPPLATAGGRPLRGREHLVLWGVVLASAVALGMAGQNLAHRILAQ